MWVTRSGMRPAAQAVHDRGRVLLAGDDEIDLGLDPGGPVDRVELEGGEEGVVALPGVVEVGDGLVEAAAGELGQHLLEVTEGLGGGVDVPEVLDAVVGPRPADEAEHPPVRALRSAVEGPAVAGRDDGQRLPVRVPARRDDLLPGEAGHPLDVLHEQLGLAEDEVVDALIDVLDESRRRPRISSNRCR